jgi:hypothetical protein
VRNASHACALQLAIRHEPLPASRLAVLPATSHTAVIGAKKLKNRPTS